MKSCPGLRGNGKRRVSAGAELAALAVLAFRGPGAIACRSSSGSQQLRQESSSFPLSPGCVGVPRGCTGRSHGTGLPSSYGCPAVGGCLAKQQGSRIRPFINAKSQFILFYFIFCSAFLLLCREPAEDDGGGRRQRWREPCSPWLSFLCSRSPPNRTREGPRAQTLPPAHPLCSGRLL